MELDDQKQLSFNFENSNDQLDIEKLNKIPYVDYSSINSKNLSFPQNRYFIFSLIAHGLLAFSISYFVIQKIIEPKTNTIEFEITDSSPEKLSSSPSLTAPLPQSNQNTMEPTQNTEDKIEISKEKEIVSTPVQPQTKKLKTAVIKNKPIIKNAKPSVLKKNSLLVSSNNSHEKMSVQSEATISDISAPELTEPSEVSDLKAPSHEEIEKDLTAQDPEFDQKLVALNSQIDSDTRSEQSQFQQETLKSAKEIEDLESAATLRANQLADERAQKKQQRLAEDEQLKQATIGSKAQSGDMGNGQGNDQKENGIVRSLEDLKQMPGNPRPNYDTEERMDGLAGTIIVHAFVTKEGKLTLFRLIQSTGHRSLDRKTLNALKNWKFYPGQEGWVELPFKWDLKGGVQQKPTLLKRSH